MEGQSFKKELKIEKSLNRELRSSIIEKENQIIILEKKNEKLSTLVNTQQEEIKILKLKLSLKSENGARNGDIQKMENSKNGDLKIKDCFVSVKKVTVDNGQLHDIAIGDIDEVSCSKITDIHKRMPAEPLDGTHQRTEEEEVTNTRGELIMISSGDEEEEPALKKDEAIPVEEERQRETEDLSKMNQNLILKSDKERLKRNHSVWTGNEFASDLVRIWSKFFTFSRKTKLIQVSNPYEATDEAVADFDLGGVNWVGAHWRLGKKRAEPREGHD